MNTSFRMAVPGFAAAIMLALALPAWAHAQLDHAAPAVGSKVDAGPTQVQIWFTDDVKPQDTAIKVFNAGDTQVDLSDCAQDKDNKGLMSVSLQPKLPPGVYTVKWNATCVDGHKTDGTFTFEIKKGK